MISMGIRKRKKFIMIIIIFSITMGILFIHIQDVEIFPSNEFLITRYLTIENQYDNPIVVKINGTFPESFLKPFRFRSLCQQPLFFLGALFLQKLLFHI